MNTENNVLTAASCDLRPHISWSALFSGAIVGVGLGFLLHLFSIAIGLSAFSSTADGAKVITIGGILGLLIGVIASMGVSGFVAGYLGRFHYSHCHGGVIYGFLTWSIALLLSALFFIPLMHYISASTKDLAPETVMTQLLNNSTTTPIQKNELAATQSTPTEKNVLAGSAWVVFTLFFIGALASCIGACCGMNCKHHEKVNRSKIHDSRY